VLALTKSTRDEPGGGVQLRRKPLRQRQTTSNTGNFCRNSCQIFVST